MQDYFNHKTGRIVIHGMSGTAFQNFYNVYFEREEKNIDKSILFGLPFEYEMLVYSLPLLFPDNDNNPHDCEVSLGDNCYQYRVWVTSNYEPSITSAYFSHGPRTSSMSSA